MNSLAFAWREIRYAPRYAVLFVLAIGLGSSILAAFAGLSSALEKTLDDRARELAIADLRVEADANSIGLLRQWAEARWPGALVSEKTDFPTMARLRGGEEVQQIYLNAVDPLYPLHGAVRARDGRVLAEVLGSGRILVDERLLVLTGLLPGDTVTLGEADVTIAGVIGERTDAAISFFQLAPSVFIARADLERTALLAPGSRASHRLFINLPEGVALDAAAAELKERAARLTASVQSWRDEGRGVARFLRNTVFFLSTTGLLTLAMGGVTGAAILLALLRRAAPSLAAARAIGAPPSFPVKVFAAWLLLLSLVSGLVATLGGVVVGRAVTAGLGDLLPTGATPDDGLGLFLRIIASVLLVAFIFSSSALTRLARLPPHAALRSDGASLPRSGRARRIGLAALAAFLLFLLVRLHVGSFALAGWGLGAWLAAIGLAWLVAALLVWLGGRLAILSGRVEPFLAGREARHGLAYRALAVAFLGLAASVLLSVLLLRQNVTSEFVRSAPPGSPNVFFMNLRPGEEEVFDAAIGAPGTRFFPLVRGRVITVDGVRAAEIQGGTENAFGGGDRLTREFGLTYGETLLATDRVVEGTALWDPMIAGPQVSVHDEYRDRFGIRRGSVIAFNILGREFTATVSSFRSINRSAREPFFYFQFKPGLIEEMPATLMGGVNLPREEISQAERRVAAALPHVTFFDIAEVAALVERLIERLHRAVDAVAAAALAGGLLLMISGILVNFTEIRREAVLFRALGASRGRILAIFLIEHLFSGIAAALAAGAVSLTLVWAVMTHGFGSDWDPWWIGTLPFLAVFALVVASSGLLASTLTLRVRPMDVLRYE
jgi:putative ABC transport system permease protein